MSLSQPKLLPLLGKSATTSLRWCVSRWSLTRRVFTRLSSSPWHHWLPLPLDGAPVSQARWPVAAGLATGRVVEQMQCCSHGDNGCWVRPSTLCRQSLNGDDITQGVRRKTTSPSAPRPLCAHSTTTPNVARNVWKWNPILCKAERMFLGSFSKNWSKEWFNSIVMQKEIWRNLTRKLEKSSQNWEIWELLLVTKALWSIGGDVSPVAPVCSWCLWQNVVSILSHSLFLSPVSLSLTHCSRDEGLAPPAHDIRRLQIAAALKLPVVSACWEACKLKRTKGQLEEEGWMHGSGKKAKKKKKYIENNNQAAATSQKGAVELKA